MESLLTKKEPIKIDLVNLLDKGDMNQNLILQSGDVVYIPLDKVLNPDESKIKKSIDLSAEKYCSIHAMLKKSTKISNSFEIISEK